MRSWRAFAVVAGAILLVGVAPGRAAASAPLASSFQGEVARTAGTAPGPATPGVHAYATLFSAFEPATTWIHVALGYDNIWANGFATNSTVSFTIRQSPGGTVLAAGTTPTDGAGNASFNRYQGHHNVDLVPGMEVTADDGATARVLTLAAVAVDVVEPATDVVAGTAPAGAEVQVNVGNDGGGTGQTTNAGGDGRWSVDFTGSFDVTWLTWGEGALTDGDGDVTSFTKSPPRIGVSLTHDSVGANWFASNAVVNFTIRQSPGGTILASGSRTTDADGNAYFNRGQDHSIDLTPGMQVNAIQGTITKGLTLVALAISSVNAGTDTVVGSAPADAQLRVDLGGPSGGSSQQVTADTDGNWSANFAGTFDITYDTNANATVADGDGDTTGVQKQAARTGASLSSDNVSASSFTGGASVTFTIRQSPGGTTLASGSKTADAAGNASFNRPQDHNIDLLPGMLVTASDGTNTKGLTLVPLTITSIDFAADVVAGTAPTDAHVQVDVNGPGGPSTLWVDADGSGTWSADFSGRYDVTYATGTSALVTDTDGDTTSFQRSTAVIEASLNFDNLRANGFAPNASATFTIRESPGGSVLAQGSKPTDAGGNAQFNRPQDHGVDLVAGMQVTVGDGTTAKQVTLVPLAITFVNPATNVVAGTAQGGAQVEVHAGGGPSSTSQTATADGSGHWAVDLSPFDVTLETATWALVSDGEGDSTRFDKPPPVVSAHLSADNVAANGFTSNQTVTFTIRQSPGGAVLAQANRPSDANGNVSFNRFQDHDVDLVPGMAITVDDGTIAKQLTLAGVAIDLLDPATDVVAGVAPPNAEVQVGVGSPNGGSGQTTTADGSGHWSVDFSPFDITYATNADACVRDGDRDETHVGRQPARIGAFLTDDNVTANGFAPNGSVTFTIRQSPGGAVLAQGTRPTDSGGNAQFNRHQDHDVDLVPGMHLTVTDGVLTKQLTLAAVTIDSFDPATAVVAGSAPAGAELTVDVGNNGWPEAVRTTTADGSGHWAVDFSPFELTYTMGARAAAADADGDTTGTSREAPRISTDLGDDVVRVSGLASNGSATFTIRQSPGGTVLASGTKPTDGSGSSWFNRFQDHEIDLVAGMHVTVTDGTTTKELTLAALTIDSIDPGTDVVAGTAPAGAGVDVSVGDDMGNGTGQPTTADGSGHWSVDFSPFDVTYAMGAYASVADADGDVTGTGKQAARISASLTYDSVWGEGFAGSANVTLTVRESPGGAVLATASKTSDPGGYVDFSRYDDFDVDLVAGMQIAAGDGTVSKELTLATMTVDSVDPDADVVAGSAPPDGEVQVDVGDEMGNGRGQATTADGNGHWSVDFAPFDITYAMSANARVRDTDGDETVADRRAARIGANATWDGIWAEGFANNTEIDFTIRSGATVLASGSRTSDASGSVELNRWEDFDVDLDTGMEITVTDGTVTKVLTIAALTIASVAPETDVVSGTAPGGAEVQVGVGDDIDWSGQPTTADGSGHWSVDFSPFDVTYTMSANATVSDADGDTTSVDKHAPRISANLTGDGILADGFAGNAEIDFTIRSGATVLASGSKTSHASGYVELYRPDDFDVDLVPGLTITVGDGAATKELTLAPLAIGSVNPIGDTVSGTAPAGAEVQVNVGDGNQETGRSTTADGSGHWSVDFSPFDVTYGMGANASVPDSDGDETTADKWPPVIGANLTDDGIWAGGFANATSVSFTIRSSGGAVLASGSKTSDASGYVEFRRPGDFGVDLVAGMQITVTDGSSTKQLTLAALAITSIDPATDVVAGTAPAGADVQVGVGGNEGAAQGTTADGSGHWSVDFSPFDVTETMAASATVRDTEADETRVDRPADAIPPETTIDSGPTGATNDTTPTFTFSASETATFECRVDGGAFAPCTSPHTTIALADGAHTFEVRATDAAGNLDATPASRAFTVDTVAPQTAIDSGPSGLTNDSTPTFTFSSEAGASFQCRVDAAAFTTCNSPFTAAVLAEGGHTFEVRATDAAANVDPTPASRAFTVDATAPQTTIESGPTGSANDSTPTFTFSANEEAGFQCRVDTAAFATCSSPFTTAPLGDGAHTFEVRATDAAGNLDATPASRAFTVDTVAPQTTIDFGPSGATNDSTPTFGFSASEASTFQCRVDGGAFAGCSSPFTTDTLVDGAHTFEVRATDAAGNLDATPASRAFTVDTVAPQTTIDSGPPEVTNDSTPTFTFSSEAGASFQCRVDSAAFAACTSPHTTAVLIDGAHTFAVRAVDPAGNPDTSPATRAFTVDTGPPETTIESGPAGLTNDSTPSFTFRADEPSTFECRVDGAAFSPCSSPHTTAALVDGAHAFEVRATDSIGNVDATPAARTFTLHTGAPVTTIVSAPAALTNDATPTFSFSADEAATFQCRLDAGTFATCSAPFTTSRLGDGAHTFEVRAIDIAGNVDASPARHVFTVHTGPPDTTIVSGPAETTTDATPTFTFSANEPATFQCRVDSAAFAACSSPHTTSSLAIGSHTFEVRALDTAGNLEQTPASRVFSVSTAKASLALLSRSAKVTPSRIAAIKLRCGVAARCQGVLTLSATVRGKLVGSRRPRVKLTLGNQRFSIAAGRTATVKVRLTSRGYRLLVRVKRLPTQARVVYTQPAGGSTTTTRTITLIAARR